LKGEQTPERRMLSAGNDSQKTDDTEEVDEAARMGGDRKRKAETKTWRGSSSTKRTCTRCVST
jgi:hypothetical protein